MIIVYAYWNLNKDRFQDGRQLLLFCILERRPGCQGFRPC